jgi:hypothetical protein
MGGGTLKIMKSVCQNCGRETDSELSNWLGSLSRNPEKPIECYAAFVNGIWVKGCAYEKAIWRMKSLVDVTIGLEGYNYDKT